jgi:GT2 family glycosyltransferase
MSVEISFILPTRDRPRELARTLAALGALAPRAQAEVLVADNASEPGAHAPRMLPNGWPVRVLRRTHNEGTAARNACAREARGEWLVMLDDDSAPIDLGFLPAIREAHARTAAIAAEILLPSGLHEQGGLPEVFVGCGAAIRRAAFLASGGYDAAFGFYAEEYDLCARLLAAGHGVSFDARFRVLHEKTQTNRDMGLVLGRLVRNNGWVLARYAPDALRDEAIAACIARYRAIAMKERALDGFAHGLAELEATVACQPRTPLRDELWRRFTGEHAAREGLARAAEAIEGRDVAIIGRGKGAEIVESLCIELGARITDEGCASTLVIGTLSPGPLLDARTHHAPDGRPVIAPWEPTRLRPLEGARPRAMA